MQHTLSFLRQLRDHNNREWFADHKEDYQNSLNEFKSLVSFIMDHMEGHDSIDRDRTKVYRIYKDVRFSKDKSPYKTSWSSNIKRGGRKNRGGYYLQVEPGNTYLAGGFFGPNPQDLLHIRKQLEQDSSMFREAVGGKDFQDFYGEMRGEMVKSAPRGFSKEADNIDLIKYKQFYFRHDFSDKEVCAADFAIKVSEGFKVIRPFFDTMSEILSTDLNGLPLEG